MSWSSNSDFENLQTHCDSGALNRDSSIPWVSSHKTDHDSWNPSNGDSWDTEWDTSPPKKTCTQDREANSFSQKSASKTSPKDADEWGWGPSTLSTEHSKPKSSVIVPADKDPSEMTAEEWDAWAWSDINTIQQQSQQQSDSNSNSKPKEPVTSAGSLYDPPDASASSSSDTSWGNMRQMCAEIEKKRLASMVPIVKALYNEHSSVTALSNEQVCSLLCFFLRFH